MRLILTPVNPEYYMESNAMSQTVKQITLLFEHQKKLTLLFSTRLLTNKTMLSTNYTTGYSNSIEKTFQKYSQESIVGAETSLDLTRNLQYIQHKSCLNDTDFAVPWMPLSDT